MCGLNFLGFAAMLRKVFPRVLRFFPHVKEVSRFKFIVWPRTEHR